MKGDCEVTHDGKCINIIITGLPDRDSIIISVEADIG
jgi:hypothetical protein